MNAKQFRITSDTLSPLYKATVGFDRLFNEFENIHSAVNSQGYPPYNISKSLDDDEIYVITLAHLIHLLGGLVALGITTFKSKLNIYSKENYLGIELISIYWHFIGLLWLYLFLFFSYS